MTRLGLVTVLYNSIEVLDDFFAGLARQTYRNWFVVIVDNSPGDEVLSRARLLAAQAGVTDIRFIRNDENVGVAKANNQGIEECMGRGCDYVLLLNNDIDFPDVHLFSKLVDEIRISGAKVVAPKIYFFDSGRIWFAGGGINLISGTTKHRGEGKEDDPAYDIPSTTGYAPTCFLAISKDVFAKIGLMDEKYFVYYDDTDFIVRAKNAGYEIRYAPQLKLSHKVSSSTGIGSPFSIYYYNRNRIYFLRKHANKAVYAASLIWYMATRLYKYIIYGPKERVALVRAVRDGLALR